MRKWHEAERCRAADRHMKAAAASSTVSISKRPRGGGKGGGGDGGGGRGSCPRDWSPGLAIIVLKFVGLPMAVTS